MWRFVSLVFAVALVTIVLPSNVKSDNGQDQTADPAISRAVAVAFADVHDGWSSDEVLLNGNLHRAFIERCRDLAPNASEMDLNWTLLNLRKAGKLDVAITRQRRDRHDAYRHASEIAARLVTDKHRVTTDRMFCDPRLRSEFDKLAREISPQTDVYLLRKAAFGLRKARRLQPELVVRVAAWQREILTVKANTARHDALLIPSKPGVYLLRDSTGYLYIGEAIDLRKRIAQHLSQSDRKSLADYLAKSGATDVTIELHAFAEDSPARKAAMRRAYESELIASRKPRFNVRP